MAERFISPMPLPTPREREVLTIIAEECAEVVHRITKALRFGLSEIQPGQSLTNQQRIASELADLTTVLDLAMEEGILTWEQIYTFKSAGRFEKLLRYLQTVKEPSSTMK